MNARICLIFGMLLFGTGVCSAQTSAKDTANIGQHVKTDEEIKLNEEAVKSIRFNFASRPEMKTNQPNMVDEKPWMRFTTDVPKAYLKEEQRGGLEMKFELDLSLPSSAPQPLIGFDADKLLFENFTKRGRAIKRNRKHANAWKTYVDYKPTFEDSLKWFGDKVYSMRNMETSADSLLHKDKINGHNEAYESSEMIPMKGFTLEEYGSKYGKDN